MFGSLHPLNLVQLVGPYLLAGRVVGDNPHEFAMYLGVVPLVLCVWAVARQSELGPLTKWVWSAFAFGMLMLLLSFGQYGFLYRIMTWLPIVGEFGYPARYLMLFQVAACAMATAGFVLLIRENQLARRQREAGINYVERRTLLALWRDFEPLWCLVGVSAAVAVAGIKMRHEPYMASVPAILAGPALVSAAVVLLVAAARGRSSALVGLVLLAAFDLGMYGLSGSGFRHNANWKDYVASAQLPPGDPDGRVLVSLAQPEMLDRRTGDLMTLFGWRRADGYSSHAPRRQLDYRLLPSLRVAGVRWVGYDASTWQIAGLKPYNDKWLETPDPLPRARMVARTLQTANPAEDISRIAPDTTALVEFPLALPVSTPGKAELTADRPGFLSVRVECPAAQLLVVAESYHEGWRASIDSRPVEVFRVYGDFMGCLVEPGKHHVNFVFRPTSLQRGKMASGVGLGLLAICFFGSLTGPQRRRSPQGLG